MAYVLDGMAAKAAPLSAWVDELPRYTIIKDKLRCPREKVDAACDALQQAYRDASPTAGDGLRLDWPDRWVQVRASNTEPIIRVIAEAPTDAMGNGAVRGSRAFGEGGRGVKSARDARKRP